MIRGSVSPMWNNNFIFDVMRPNQMSGDDEAAAASIPSLTLKLYHRSSAVNKHLLGSCTVPGSDLLTYIAPSTVYFPLLNTSFGRTSQGERSVLLI